MPVKNVCIDINHSDMVDSGESLMLDGEVVGVVNSPCYSHRMEKSLALAHVRPDVPLGTQLNVSGKGIAVTAKVVESPVYDTQKTRTHA